MVVIGERHKGQVNAITGFLHRHPIAPAARHYQRLIVTRAGEHVSQSFIVDDGMRWVPPHIQSDALTLVDSHICLPLQYRRCS